MMISLLFTTLLFYSNSMEYIPFQKKKNLPLKQGFFFIKASDYSDPNYIYISLKQTNIMLNSLEFCDLNEVPSENFTYSDCSFEVIHPYKSNSDDYIIQDIYQFPKYTKKRSFIIFYYYGEIKKDFQIEVLCSDNDKFSDANKIKSDILVIAFIVIGSIIALSIILGIIAFLIIYYRKKNIIVGQIVPNPNQPGVKEPGYNTLAIK